MNIFQQIVNQKLSAITVSDLLSYSKQYNIQISRDQAQKVVTILRNKKINIFDLSERKSLLKDIAKITSPEIARQVNTIFNKFTN
ncbi:DUF2624 domain-containing protein [Bacillus timonensis]|nr:DUF2624 domain-containing protein [Bacillus timonensis]